MRTNGSYTYRGHGLTAIFGLSIAPCEFGASLVPLAARLTAAPIFLACDVAGAVGGLALGTLIARAFRIPPFRPPSGH